MSGSNWRNFAAIGLALLVPVGGASFALIEWANSRSAEYDRVARDHTEEYAADSGRKTSQACNLLAPVKKPDCLANAKAEERANERAEQDLVAQKQSALWAYVMALAAVIGMALSAVGVILVWTTFRETKLSNAIARETMERQLRGYLSVEKLGVAVFAYEGGFRVEISFEYWNRGQTPGEFIGRKIELGSRSPQPHTLVGDHAVRTIGPGSPIPVTWKPEFNFPIETYGEQAVFKLNVEYKCMDIFGEVQHRRTDYMFWFSVADARRVKGASPHVDCKGSYTPETDWFEESKREIAKHTP